MLLICSIIILCFLELLRIKSRDITTRKIYVRTCQWWAESAPPGCNRVKVSQNLGATAVAPVAPVDTSLAYVARRFKFKEFPANFASIPKQIKNSLTFKNNKSLIHMQTSQQSRPGETFSIQVGGQAYEFA